jgi:Crp-like helix-turn-helix domain
MDRSSFSRNIILSGLARDPSFAAIQDRFTLTTVKVHQTVQEPHKPMRYVIFPLSGMISSVVQMRDGASVEVCCVGCQGMINWETLLDEKRSRYRHFCQLRAEVASIPCQYLMPFVAHPAIANYITIYTGEVARNAACNCLHRAEERLARWLLVASDKVESEELALTQEFLAMMLGARRATVTLAAEKLQNAGLILYRRGHLRIVNRKALIAAACECYESLPIA